MGGSEEEDALSASLFSINNPLARYSHTLLKDPRICTPKPLLDQSKNNLHGYTEL